MQIRFRNKTIELQYTDVLYSLLLFFCLLILFSYIFSYSMDLEGVEFLTLMHLQFFQKYGHLYLNPDAFPYFIYFYPPLHSYVELFLMKFCQVNLFADYHKAMVVGRVLSFILFIADVSLLMKIIRLYIPANRYRLFILLLFLLLVPMHLFSVRPDGFKVFFFLRFLFYSLRYETDNKIKWRMQAMISAVIAVFFKHDVILYIFAFYAAHFIFYRKKETLFNAIAFGILTAGGFIFFSLLHGPYFLPNILNYNIQYSFDLRLNLLLLLAFLLKSIPFIFLLYVNYRSENASVKFLSLLGTVYFFVTAATLLRPGANMNYTYESVALWLINLGIFLHTRTIKYQWIGIVLAFFLLKSNKYLSDTSILKPEYKNALKETYEANIQEAGELPKVIGNDVIFFPAAKELPFNNKLNAIYGYERHMDRYTSLYKHLAVPSVLLTDTITARYDALFANGYVKYLATEDSPEWQRQWKQYYPSYLFYTKVGRLNVYRHN